MKKNKKLEKETRRLVEAMSDIIKNKNGKYKFKHVKKKQIKQIKRRCVHWYMGKGGKLTPAVAEHDDKRDFWTCGICGKSFLIAPLKPEEYTQASEEFLSLVNQCFFYSVKMGGDASDTKLFLKLKELVPIFGKVAKNEIKQLNKRNEYEQRRRNNENNSQFNNYSAYYYNNN